MKHEVRWKEPALDRLTNAWLNADSASRQLITAAANSIDERLERDPESEGESREDQRRILFDFPLGVIFVVNSADRIVYITQVWVVRRRS